MEESPDLASERVVFALPKDLCDMTEEECIALADQLYEQLCKQFGLTPVPPS